MKINNKKNTIEISKKFAKAAEKFGSQEYRDLQEARKDYPTYKIMVVSHKAPAKRETTKGLTYEYMESYIKSHDDEEQTIMNEYLNLRGLSEEAKEALAESLSYQEMREWFLGRYPAIAAFHKKRAEILAA